MSSRLYRFREFRLDPAARELRDASVPIELPTSAFDCLLYLLERRERAVGRDELMAAVWGRVDVADSLLGQTVLRVRRALGDTGNEQHTIRTVPRFGYRWVAALDESEEEPAAAPRPSDPAMPRDAAAPIGTLETQELPGVVVAGTVARSPVPARPRRAAWATLAMVATLVVFIILFLAFLGLSRRPALTTGIVAKPAPAISTPALVLPAVIDASDDWSWLRLGLMDLIATRLRRGELATAASESVVALVKTHSATAPDAWLDASPLIAQDTLRVLPRVSLRDGRWTVALTVRGEGRALQIESQAGDAMSAAREAADTLLLRLGHMPPPTNGDTTQALTELLQRTRAAMLADQLQLAGDLIRSATPALRERPEIELRLAQIELRAGEYVAVEQRVNGLLDRLSAGRDAALRGRALNTLAATYVRRNRAEDAQRSYDEAIALLQGKQEPDALGLSLLGRGLVAVMHGKHAQAVADLGLARSEMDAAGNPLGVAQVDLNLALIEALRLRPATALPALQEVAARFERLGAQEEYVFALASSAEVQQVLLDHAAALATTDQYWPPESHSQNLRLRWKLTLVRAEALTETGKLDAAEALAASIERDADPDADASLRAKAIALRSRIALARGDAVNAARLAFSALTPTLADSDMCRHTQAWMTRLRALRRSGDVALAGQETVQFREWSKAHPDAWRDTYASLALAEQLWSENRRDDARQSFARSVELADQAGGIPDDLVEVIRPYASALIVMGHMDDARSLSARIAPYAERDLRAADVFVRLNAALNLADALQQAESRVVRLAGERAVALGALE